ncbi:MAG: STAS/SEC14 domain-containing protein [Silicimonas sp.]|nr:STAS/SEC14 domain-containing protein [Silicimonas sp.]
MACIYTEDKTAPIAEIKVIGRVTEHDMDEIIPKLEAFIGRHGTIRLIEIIERFDGFDPTTILDGMKFDAKHMTDITHAAIVTDIPWLGFMTNVADVFMPIVVRKFDVDALEDARAWVRNVDKAAA